jgi:hypothetical protein
MLLHSIALGGFEASSPENAYLSPQDRPTLSFNFVQQPDVKITVYGV